MDGMWPRRALLLGTAAAVTGCAIDPIDLTPPPSAAPSASEVVAEVEPGYVARAATGSEKTVPETEGLNLRVATPHVNFVIEAVGFLDKLGAEAALELGEASALKPATGHRLAVVLLRADQPTTRLTAGEVVQVVLQSGTTEHGFDDLFGAYHEATGAYDRPWEMVCCSVADDAPIMLRVNDADRTVTVDLRKRAPLEDDAWRATKGYRERRVASCDPLSGIARTTFVSQPPATLEADTGTFNLIVNPDVSAGLNPWLRGNGWAANGQWLAMRLAVVVEIPEEAPGIRLDLDIGRTFTYIAANGSRHPGASSLDLTLDDLRVGRVAPTIAFDIPDGDDTGSIVINPVGTASYAYDDGTTAPARLTAADPVTFTVAYSDAVS